MTDEFPARPNRSPKDGHGGRPLNSPKSTSDQFALALTRAIVPEASGTIASNPETTTMPTVNVPPVTVLALDDGRDRFVRLLPAVTARAAAAFRGLPCPHDRADAVAEVVARAWAAVAAFPPASDGDAAVAVAVAEATADVRRELLACPAG